jgi:hypothetical protein
LATFGGIELGEEFTFVLWRPLPAPSWGDTVQVPAGPVPDGNCLVIDNVPAGTIRLYEVQFLDDVLVRAIRVDDVPVSGIPDFRLLEVSIAAETTTEVVYVNARPTRTSRLCKIAGDGIAPGTNFQFAVESGAHGRSVTLAAGAPPQGNCTVIEVGQERPFSAWPLLVVVTEIVPSNVVVSSITADNVNVIDLAGGRVSFAIPAFAPPPVVVYTNRAQ